MPSTSQRLQRGVHMTHRVMTCQGQQHRRMTPVPGYLHRRCIKGALPAALPAHSIVYLQHPISQPFFQILLPSQLTQILACFWIRSCFEVGLALHSSRNRFCLKLSTRDSIATAMDALRSADAHVAAATHPRGNMRWRLQRYNPMARLRWQKNRVSHPVGHQRAHTRARMNSLNPLFYLRRIKNNLSSVGRRRTTTRVI